MSMLRYSSQHDMNCVTVHSYSKLHYFQKRTELTQGPDKHRGSNSGACPWSSARPRPSKVLEPRRRRAVRNCETDDKRIAGATTVISAHDAKSGQRQHNALRNHAKHDGKAMPRARAKRPRPRQRARQKMRTRTNMQTKTTTNQSKKGEKKSKDED